MEQTPLQLYHSGTIFSPKASIAPSPLEDRQYPEYIIQPINMNFNWPQNQTLEVLDDRLSQMAFLLDNKLASICCMEELRIWDQKSCSCLHRLDQGFKWGYITILSWYRSRTIAVGWPDIVRIWNLDTGACVRDIFLKGCSGTETIAFSDDGKFTCSICTRDFECVAFIHCLDTGKRISEFEVPDKPRPILLSPQGQWIAAIAKESMLLSKWSPSTEPSWTVLDPQHEHDILAFSTDGALVASLSSTSKIVKVWITESRECLHILDFEAPIVHDQLALTKDWLVVSLDSYLTFVMDMKTGAVSKIVSSHFKAGPVISDDGTLLAGQSLDGAVRIWDLTSKAFTENATEQLMGMELVAPIADDNTILSHSWGIVKIWDMESGTCKETLEPEVPLMTQTFVAAATDAPVFATLKETTVEIWNIDPLRHIKTLQREFSCLGERYYCLAISANGERLAIGSSEPGSVEIWDEYNAVLEHTLEVPLMDFPCIAISPDGAKIAYFLMENIEIRCLPVLETLTVATDRYPKVSYLRTLAFRDGRLIGMYMNTQVQVWDASTGECLFLSQPCPELRMFNLATNFLNTDVIAHSGHRGTDDTLGPFYIGQDPAWVMKNGEKILWLPPDYRPESVYVSGTTMVLGTFSGRVSKGIGSSCNESVLKISPSNVGRCTMNKPDMPLAVATIKVLPRQCEKSEFTHE
jgi:WD40 repeat protein